MGFNSGEGLYDCKKINNDISRISCDRMSESQIEESLLKIVDRTSSVSAFVSKNGLKVKGVSIFSQIEESEFFLLYFSIRRLILEKESNNDNIENRCLMNKIQTILVHQYFPVVLYWDSRVSSSTLERCGRRHLLSAPDRMSEAFLVLVKCINKFDFCKGVRFLSYALGSLCNVLNKDYRDRKKDIQKLSFFSSDIIHSMEKKCTSSNLHNLDCVPIVGNVDSKKDSLILTEIKDIFDGCINNTNSASFLSSIEKSIICLEFDDSFCVNGGFESQECKARELNINIDNYRRKKKSAFDKIEKVTVSRILKRNLIKNISPNKVY